MKYREKPYTNQYQEKPKKRFNFSYDEDQITYRTQIPQIPTKTKHKPDQKLLTKKIKDIQDQIHLLKKQRKQKKQQYQNASKDFDFQISQNQYHRDLGKKCLQVLIKDIGQYQQAIQDIQNKIFKKKKDLKFIDRQPIKRSNKKIQQMNYEELQNEENYLNRRLTTEELNKKQQTQLFNLINKIKRLKEEAPQAQNTNNTQNKQLEKAQLLQSIDRLTKAKKYNQNNLQTTNMKIKHIQEDIIYFEQQIQKWKELKSKNSLDKLHQEAQKIKQQIYKAREQLDNIQAGYQTKLNQYQYEQEKIKWIQWAKGVQQKKNRLWEEQKNQRKRQKLKEKDKQVGKQGKKGETDVQKKYQKPIINKYQPQIDCCSFLIAYCKDLYPKQSNQQQKQQKKQIDLNNIIKEGQWAKNKGIQVIVSKKMKNQQIATTKPKKKEQKKKDVEQQVKQKLNHIFQVQTYFQKVNVIPPINVNELQKTIASLQQKLKYYLDHPQGKQTQKKNYNDKYAQQKYSKVKQTGKRYNQGEDFPSLN